MNMIDTSWIRNNPKTTAAGVVAAVAAVVGALWPESPWPEAIIGVAAAAGLVVARDGDVGERRAETGRKRGGQRGKRARKPEQSPEPALFPLWTEERRVVANPDESAAEAK